MVNGGQIRIKLDRTEEALTGQGGFLAFGEYLNGIRSVSGLKNTCLHREATGGLRQASLCRA